MRAKWPHASAMFWPLLTPHPASSFRFMQARLRSLSANHRVHKTKTVKHTLRMPQAIRDAARRSSGSAALWPVRFLLDRVLPQGSAAQATAATTDAEAQQALPSPPGSNGSTAGAAGLNGTAAGSGPSSPGAGWFPVDSGTIT